MPPNDVGSIAQHVREIIERKEGRKVERKNERNKGLGRTFP